MFRMDGKTVLISGGAQGIGAGIARVFTDAGAVVVICDLNEGLGNAAAKELSSNGGKAYFCQADISSETDVQRVIKLAIAKTGRVDSVINNASFTSGKQHDVLGADREEWDNNYRVGLIGTWLLTAAALPHIKAQGGGSVIVISSVQALSGCQNSAPYTSIKAAQLGFVKSAAVDYGPFNIRVNAICPGPIRVRYSPPPGSEAHEWQKSQTVLRRTGMPEDIGHAALFLASDEGAFITGVTLPVDGGWTAK